MKFESKLAQEAYDRIISCIRLINPKDTFEVEARAIEVAAKIEIEQHRVEIEHDAMLAKAGFYRADITDKRCKNNDD
jgi:hypothetical protein